MALAGPGGPIHGRSRAPGRDTRRAGLTIQLKGNSAEYGPRR